jgi:hypothetical protein
MNQVKEDLRALLESKITADEAWWKLRDVRIIIQIFPKKCPTICRWLEENLGYFDNHGTT